MLTRALKQAACGLFFFAMCASVANASKIGVSPVRLTLSDNQKIDSLSVRNNGSEPITMQMEVLSWSQREGKAVFAATRELLANPPIFTIPAGNSQLVRVGLRRAPDAQRELAYRVILEELPPPPNPDAMGMFMTIRISLPVFVLPEIDTKPVLLWQAARTSQGALKISLSNNGNAHIQIKNFKLSLLDSAQPWLTQQTSDYVLAGQSRDWILPVNADYPTPPSGDTLQLFAQTDAGDIEADVLIAP
jgi:fimbrial chaperone protein